MKTLVLAGGFGTRLRPLSCTRPKALFPIANKPIIDFVLEYLKGYGVETVVMGVYYMAEDIVRYLGPTKYGLGILYSREQRPMGTGGPVRKALDMLNGETFTVMNGDIITDFNMGELVRRHKKYGGVATLALTRVENPHIYGSVELGEEGLIKRFVEKPEYGKAPSNLVNAGIYVLEPDIVDYIPEEGKTRIETQVFPVLVEEGQLYGFENQCFWLDVGAPEVDRLLEFIRNEEENTVLDFGRVIPLPNGEWDYDFCIQNWGTKWNASEPYIEDEWECGSSKTVLLTFSTPWSPPIPVVKKLIELFPSLSFDLRYFEGGAAFNGVLMGENGEITYEDEGKYFGSRGG